MKILPLIKEFEKYIPLNDNEKSLLEEKFSKQEVKRKQKILSEGIICKHYTFIVEGCFRMYGVDDRGYQHNIQFAAENDWIADLASFHDKETFTAQY